MNLLPKLVGGAFQHADVKPCRASTRVDFRLKSAIDALIAAHAGARRARLRRRRRRAPTSPTGRSATTTSSRSTPRPSSSTACRATTATRSPRGGAGRTRCRPASRCTSPCCSRTRRAATEFFGRPAHARTCSRARQLAAPRRPPALRRLRPVQRLRLPDQREGRAGGHDRSARRCSRGRCQLRYNAPRRPSGARAAPTSRGVDYVDGDGAGADGDADAYMLAASAIESARLCLLSDPDAAGNPAARSAAT